MEARRIDNPDGSYTLEYPDGRVSKRDSLGRIIGGVLPSDKARELGSKGAAVAQGRFGQVDRLLTEAGYDPQDCPEYARVMASQAAQNSAAMAAWRRMVMPDNTSGIVKPRCGERCPTCGTWNFELSELGEKGRNLAQEKLAVLLGIVRERRAAGQEALDPAFEE